MLTDGNLDEVAEKLSRAVARGALVCFPTDTVYGIGGRAFSREVLEKLMTVKPDRSAKPTAVLIDSIIRMSQCAGDVPGPKIVALAERYWPGPLTMIWKVSNVIDKEYHGPDNSLGYRVPDSPLLLGLLRELELPLWATSANLPGMKAPGLFSEIHPEVLAACEITIQSAAMLRGRASTVVDVRGREPIVLRSGSVHESEILNVWSHA